MKRKPFQPLQAVSEGWSLIHSADGPSVIRAHDEAGIFGADGHAIAHVREQSDAGSTYHADALSRAGLL